MTTAVEFCLLGPLEVRSAGLPVPIPAGKQRAVLATLLLAPNQMVTLDELAESLWGSDPPPSARTSTQNYVMRLRRALGAPGDSRISTQPNGYVIRVDADELDVDRFERLLRAGLAAARDGSWQLAAETLAQGLALWRGAPLADVQSEGLAASDAPRLAELRVQALETRIDADLHLGRDAEVIGELRRLTAAHPLREHLQALLILALYRDGRQADALAAYQTVRRTLVGELGTEPGSELQELHQRVLAADPALAAGPRIEPSGSFPVVVPRELPSTVLHFTGRVDELEKLTALLNRSAAHPAATVVISAIGGIGGIGKTALAVNWAHQVADRFPDGQLYANLRGYDPGQPVSAADALATFLRSLGIAAPEVPVEERERAARYRSLLSGKRTLIVLDNARSVDQVRPLLPGSPSCAVVVTSRDSLAGLVVRDGAVRLDLDTLSEPDALGLLRALVGERVDAEPEAAATLAARCSWLPLALRVAAELAIAQPQSSLADLASELADERGRLDVLASAADDRTAIRTVFSWSYRNLDPGLARTFRLTSLHPGAAFDSYAVAALTSSSLEEARHDLDALARAYLVQPAGLDRYSMHDLLRAYAGDLAAGIDGPEQTRAAVSRLLDHYLSAAAQAMDAMYPAQRHRRPRISPSPGPTPPVSDPGTALAFLDCERANLVAMANYAADHDWPTHATRFSATLFRYLQDGSHAVDELAIYSAAEKAARASGDIAAEAASLTGLGAVSWRQGRHRQAADYYARALAKFRAADDRIGQARVLHNLGLVDADQGDYRQAACHHQQALDMFRDADDQTGQAGALNSLGNLAENQGRYDEASDCYGKALVLYGVTGNQRGEALALGNLGIVAERLGNYGDAAEHHRQALALSRQLGNRTSEACALDNLGLVDWRLGRYLQAADWHRHALEIYQDTGDPVGEASARNGLAKALLAVGNTGNATREHAAALILAVRIGHKREQARAHDGLGHCAAARHDTVLARTHWEQALALYGQLRFPEADRMRTQLAQLDQPLEGESEPIDGR